MLGLRSVPQLEAALTRDRVMIQAGNTAMLRLLQPNDLVVAQEQLTRCKHRPRFPLSPEGDSPQREKFYGCHSYGPQTEFLSDGNPYTRKSRMGRTPV